MREFRFLAEVYDDLATTVDWLDSKRAGLGEEFEFEFFAAVQRATQEPASFAMDHTGYRPVRLKRFSAVKYFTTENEVIVIAGVFMGGRSEQNLKNRI